MGKRSKIEKIHRRIMCASQQIHLLSNFICNVTENEVESQILAEIINEKSIQISNANEKMGLMFKI